MPTLDDTWRKSVRSNNNGSCVEVRLHDHAVQVRDTKDTNGPVLAFSRAAWSAFMTDVKTDGYDR